MRRGKSSIVCSRRWKQLVKIGISQKTCHSLLTELLSGQRCCHVTCQKAHAYEKRTSRENLYVPGSKYVFKSICVS